MASSDRNTDWRAPYDPELEEWVWELRDERAGYPNLRSDLQPLDVDESGDIPPRAEESQAHKETDQSFS